MSKESLQKFIQFLANNKEISDKIKAYGREKGFIFDKNDMELFAKEILDSSDELSDEELELAAGGTTIGAAILAGIVLSPVLAAGVFLAVAAVLEPLRD